MAVVRARYLVDESDLARMPEPAVRERLGPMVAAAAEAAGLTVLHYDAHFDRIATVTGQAMEWVVPQGSV